MIDVPVPCSPDPMPIGGTPERLEAALRERLDAFIQSSDEDPFSNPVLHLALDISRRLAAKSIGYADLERLIQHLSVQGFRHRAKRLRQWLGEVDMAANQARLVALLRRLAEPGGPDNADSRLSFAEFREKVEGEVYGFVVTAHPTFNLSGALMTDLACLSADIDAQGRPLDNISRGALEARVASVEHRPDRVIDLNREHELSQVAIGNMQRALRRVWDAALSVAAELYPEDWTTLTPRLATVASWVGYDLDGRSDIRWNDTIGKRLSLQQQQLRYYLAEVTAIARGASRDQDELRHTMSELESRLALALREIGDEIAVMGQAAPESQEAVFRFQTLAQRMHADLDYRLHDAAVLIERVNRAIRLLGEGKSDGKSDVGATIRRLCVLRAEMATFGLAMAHTHVRINATQIHNAIRRQVAMDTAPDDPRYRLSYLERINELLDSVEPVSINFGSLIGERTSAKRLFMIVAQMLKYSDSTTPVRFLIAESEAAFTLLAALYFAKLFGIDDRLDISPLFETGKALEVGSRVIDTVLENPHFRAYVQKRGRLCIQTGYSDAGRYLGQAPAAASIERLRNRIARLFAKHGLTGVQLVVFDTHGESIGRGAHPAGLPERLAYTCPPAWRSLLDEVGVPLKQETSFQGGDGFLPFATEPTALAVVTRVMEYMLTPADAAAGDDPYYQEHDYITEFFTEVTTFQSALVADPNYAMLVTAFGANLLFPSGSRSGKRQYDGAVDIDHLSITQTRAIPHNAILQQLGFPANSIGGVGAAIDKDPRRYAGLYERSARLRQLMGIVEYGAALTDTDALRAYVDTLDPGLWLTIAAHTADPVRVREIREVAALLEDDPSNVRQLKIYRKLLRDHGLLIEGLGLSGAGCGRLVDDETRTALRLLHAVRLALIHEIYRLAVHVPEFSSQHHTTRERVIARLMHLDVPSTVAELRAIFPATSGTGQSGDFGEVATYVGDESQGYAREHRQILQPLDDLHTLVARVGTAIVQRVGYFG